MATNTDDTGLIREEFRKIHDLFIELKETLCKDNVDFKEISMGMSHDYPIAIQEGSTLIRWVPVSLANGNIKVIIKSKYRQHD